MSLIHVQTEKERDYWVAGIRKCVEDAKAELERYRTTHRGTGVEEKTPLLHEKQAASNNTEQSSPEMHFSDERDEEYGNARGQLSDANWPY